MDADQSIKEYRADVIRKLNRDKLASPELEAELIELCEIGWHIKNTLPELAKDCSYIGLITRTYPQDEKGRGPWEVWAWHEKDGPDDSQTLSSKEAYDFDALSALEEAVVFAKDIGVYPENDP
jgi:hypothetical protein